MGLKTLAVTLGRRHVVLGQPGLTFTSMHILNNLFNLKAKQSQSSIAAIINQSDSTLVEHCLNFLTSKALVVCTKNNLIYHHHATQIAAKLCHDPISDPEFTDKVPGFGTRLRELQGSLVCSDVQFNTFPSTSIITVKCGSKYRIMETNHKSHGTINHM